MGQSTLHGALDDGAVGQRIAEGHTELDHIGAGIDGGERNGPRGLEAWVASRQVNNQPGFSIESNRHENQFTVRNQFTVHSC